MAWADLTHLSVPPLDLVFRAVAVYVSVLVLLRLAGKRQVGQMSPTEFVAILLISNAVQNAMNAGDNSLVGGLLLAAALIFTSWLISVLTFHSRRISAVFEGSPTLLIHHGQLVEKHLHQERLTREDVQRLLRKQNIHRIDEVRTAILEADGSLTVVTRAEA